MDGHRHAHVGVACIRNQLADTAGHPAFEALGHVLRLDPEDVVVVVGIERVVGLVQQQFIVLDTHQVGGAAVVGEERELLELDRPEAAFRVRAVGVGIAAAADLGIEGILDVEAPVVATGIDGDGVVER